MNKRRFYKFCCAMLAVLMLAQPALAAPGLTTDQQLSGVNAELDADGEAVYRYKDGLGSKVNVGEGSLDVTQTGYVGYPNKIKLVIVSTDRAPASGTTYDTNYNVTYNVYLEQNLVGTATGTATDVTTVEYWSDYVSPDHYITRSKDVYQSTTMGNVTLANTTGANNEVLAWSQAGNHGIPGAGQDFELDNNGNIYAFEGTDTIGEYEALKVDVSTQDKTYKNTGNPTVINNKIADRTNAHGVLVTGAHTYTEGSTITAVTTVGDSSHGYAFNSSFTGTASLGMANVSTSGDASSGIDITGSGNVTKADGNITTTGTNAHGVHAHENGGGSVTLANVNISADHGDALRSEAKNGETITHNGGTISVSGWAGYAGEATAGKNTIVLNGVTVNKADAGGLKAVEGAEVKAQGNTTITTTGAGIVVEGERKETTGTLDGSTINSTGYGMMTEGEHAKGFINNGTITTSGVGQHAVVASKDSTITFDGTSNLTTTGTGAHGVTVQTDGIVTVANDNTRQNITTSGQNASGVYVSGHNDDDVSYDITLGVVSADTTGTKAHGIEVRNAGQVKVKEAIIATTGSGADGINVREASSDLYITGNASIDVTQSDTSGGKTGAYVNGGTLTIGGNLDVNAKGPGNQAHGHFVTEGGTSKISGDATLVTSGDNSRGLRVEKASSATIDGKLTAKTNGEHSEAVIVDNSILIVSKDATIATSGDNSIGLKAASGDVTVGGAVVINTAGANSNGLDATAKSDVKFNDTLKVDTKGASADAVYVSQSKLTVDKAVDIDTTGDNADGLHAYNSSTVTLKDKLDVTTSGDESEGVHLDVMSSLAVSKDATITTSGDKAHGFVAHSASSADIGGNLKVEIKGENADAIDINNSTLKVAGSADIKTVQDNSTGFKATSGDVTVGGAVVINTTGKGSAGLVAKNSNVKFHDTLNVTTTSDDAIGVSLDHTVLNVSSDATIETSGDRSIALVVSNDATATIGGNLDVDTEGENADAVLVDNSKLAVVGSADIKTVQDNSTGLKATSGDVTVGKAVVINTTGKGSAGLVAKNSNVKFHDTLNVTTASDDAAGVSLDKTILFVSSDATIATSGDKAPGLLAINASSADIGGNLDVDTTGASSDAVLVDNSKLAVVGSADIKTVQDNSTGLKVDSGDVTVGKAVVINTAGANSNGLDAKDSTVTFNDTLNVTTTSDDAIGVSLDKTVLNVKGNATIETNGENSAGLTAVNSSDVQIGGNLTVTTASADAINLDNGSQLTVKKDATIVASGDKSDAIAARNGSKVTVEGMSTLTPGKNGYAALAEGSNSKIDLLGGVSADVTADNSVGLAASNDVTAQVYVKGDATLNVTGEDAVGIVADKGNVTVNGDTAITMTGAKDGATGIKLANNGMTILGQPGSASEGKLNITAANAATSGDAIVGISSEGGDLYVNKEAVIDIKAGDLAVGIAASADTNLYFADALTVKAEAEDAVGIGASAGTLRATTAAKAANIEATATSGDAYGVAAEGASADITLESTERGTLKATATGGRAAAVAVSGDATVSLKNFDVSVKADSADKEMAVLGDKGTVNADNVKLTGNVINVAQTPADSGLTVNLNNLSQLEGFVKPEIASVDAVTNINIAGANLGLDNKETNSSKWLVTGDSDLNGTLKNDGILEFAKDKGYLTVETAKLEGTNGLYKFGEININNAEAVVDPSDPDAVSRQAHVIFADQLGSNATGVVEVTNKSNKTPWYQDRMDQPLVVVKNSGAVGSGESTNFRLGNRANAIELGSWAYTMESGLATDVTGATYTEWYLKNFDMSATAHSVLASVVNPDIWYLETNALYSHIGDFTPKRGDTEVWGHAVYNKLKHSSAYGYNGTAKAGDAYTGNDVEQEFYGLTAGIDKRFETNKGQWFNGIMFGYGEGDLDRKFGSTDFNSFHVGLYSVYLTDSDWYLAGLLKYNRYDTDMKVSPRGAASFKDSFDQDGWGASVMAGKQIPLKNDWFVEPQLEFGFHRVKGTSFTTTNGMDVNVEDADSMRLRGGLAFGRKYALKDGAKLDLFAKASIVHEFDGETDVLLFGEPFKTDYSGTWGQYKIGLNYDAGKDYFVNFALSYENGGDRESPFGVELGMKWLMGPKPEKKAEVEAGAEVETKTEAEAEAGAEAEAEKPAE